MTSDLYFIINVFNVIIISIDNFICALLYAIERVYRLPSLNPENNHNHNHNHTLPKRPNYMLLVRNKS